MAGFNIEAFKSQVNQKAGIQRTNRFLVTFPPPRQISILRRQENELSNIEINRNIEYWCESVNLPGYQLATHDVRRWTIGPIEKRPYAPNFGQLQCVFLSDGDGYIWSFFNDWMNFIMPHDTDQGINRTESRYEISTGVAAAPYEINYKENYVTELNIMTYHENGDPIQNIVCREAFPTSVQDISFQWQDTNNVVRIQVTFDFLDWFARPVTQAR